MLWIGNKVSTGNLILYVLLPSIVCFIVPVFIASMLPAFKGEIEIPEEDKSVEIHKRGATMLYLGLSSIVFVPVFKTVTHLPLCWYDAFIICRSYFC